MFETVLSSNRVKTIGRTQKIDASPAPVAVSSQEIAKIKALAASGNIFAVKSNVSEFRTYQDVSARLARKSAMQEADLARTKRRIETRNYEEDKMEDLINKTCEFSLPSVR